MSYKIALLHSQNKKTPFSDGDIIKEESLSIFDKNISDAKK